MILMNLLKIENLSLIKHHSHSNICFLVTSMFSQRGKKLNLRNIRIPDMRRIILLIFLIPVLISCKDKNIVNSSSEDNQDQLILSVLWYQRSAEMQALYYQGYNIAKQSLERMLARPDNKKPKAVIMDIDETVLDNSPVEAYQVINNVQFSDSIWLAWVKKACAEPLPGALDFIRFAESKEVEVFYISNRKSPAEYEPTIINLREKGFPFADSVHVILKKESRSKEIRRKYIAEKYDILLLIGDNLADFDSVFENRSDDLGFGAVKNKKDEFGNRFIVLPDPMYGPWIDAAVRSAPGKTVRDKILQTLRSF
jgi:5'-nucleotidase (lipoprotein e(P4) family)